MSMLRVRALELAYGREPVLSGVDLEVRPGERWFLIGPNGSGKSTLLRAVLGLLPTRSGTIEFDADIPVGIMVEVPSAALTATTLAREVAFFSIGTNDLIQYTLAVDRGNERVANLYTAAHPAVLQLIRTVVRAARRFKVETSLCGEIAGEVEYTMLLMGMGLRTLSMVPSQILHVKRVIRSVDIGTCERLARKVGSFDSERQVLNFLREEVAKVLPEMAQGRFGG